MATIFFGGCTPTADHPEESKKLAEYIKGKYGVDPIGCCRVNHPKLTEKDTAIVVCNNCANIITESGKADHIDFVWEIIDNDPDFPFPDYHGEKMTLQDCWMAVGKDNVHNAIRSLLRKMNIDVVELAENRNDTKYCGMKLASPCMESDAKLAPKRYVQEGAHMFQPIPPEERPAHFKKYCEQFTTDKVVCYCRSCRGGLLMGGKNALHVLELLFPKD